MRNTRLAGHGLKREGKPCTAQGGRAPGPSGRALCSGGERSPVLESDGQRKRWHRDIHKPAMAAQQENP